MRRPFGFVLFFLALAAVALAKRHREADHRLSGVRTIFVKGNNEAALRAREKLSSLTCFTQVSNPEKADAILDFDQAQSINGAMLAISHEKSIVSAVLTLKSGDLIWSGSSSHEAGLVNSGSGSATQFILFKLNRAAFPDIKTGFHGVDRSTCPN